MSISAARPNDFGRRLRVALLARLSSALVRALGLTWRYTLLNGESLDRLRAERTAVVLVLWHGELLPFLWLHRGEGIAVLISHHSDGEIIARVGQSLGYGAVRGSTSRGGARAILAMAQELDRGRDVAITPDGPRGPRHVFAPGALAVAQRSGKPIVCGRVNVSRAWHLRSWDNFVIPKPFARIAVVYSDPQVVMAVTAREAEADAPRFERLMAHLIEETGAA